MITNHSLFRARRKTSIVCRDGFDFDRVQFGRARMLSLSISMRPDDLPRHSPGYQKLRRRGDAYQSVCLAGWLAGWRAGGLSICRMSLGWRGCCLCLRALAAGVPDVWYGRRCGVDGVEAFVPTLDNAVMMMMMVVMKVDDAHAHLAL